MKKFISSLKEEEKIILKLRKHYEQYGYKKIKLSKFESYDLYNENADFIKIENIITFGTNRKAADTKTGCNLIHSKKVCQR